MVWCRWLVLHRWSPYPGTCVRTCHTISPFVTQWRQHGPTVMLKHERWCWLIHLTLSICSNFRLFPSLMPLYIAIGFWMIFFCFSLTTDGSFTQDFIFENFIVFYNWCKAFGCLASSDLEAKSVLKFANILNLQNTTFSHFPGTNPVLLID